jgi:hypothetical protein
MRDNASIVHGAGIAERLREIRREEGRDADPAAAQSVAVACPFCGCYITHALDCPKRPPEASDS